MVKFSTWIISGFSPIRLWHRETGPIFRALFVNLWHFIKLFYHESTKGTKHERKENFVLLQFRVFVIDHFGLRFVMYRHFYNNASLPSFHLGQSRKPDSPCFWKSAYKKQNADIKAESCLLFSGIKTQYFEGWRNRQGIRTLFHSK